MNIPEIESVLRELHKITGFRISLHDADFMEIAAYPQGHTPFCRSVKQFSGEHARCETCDREACLLALKTKDTYIYKCRFGLTEAVSPLYNFGTLTGFLMMGQVVENDEEADFAAREYASITRSIVEGKRMAAGIPRVSRDMMESYINIMTVCARYLTLSNATRSASPSTAELAKIYLSDRIGEKISVSDICDAVGCSKSTLLSSFKKRYGITVNTYLTSLRLERAKELLDEGSSSIAEIAAECGFSDQSYFSKVFSALVGISPSEYRQERKKATSGEEMRKNEALTHI